jgi:hypothetical protein
MSEGIKRQDFMSKLDEALEEYSKKFKVDSPIDIYSEPSRELEHEALRCKFKDSCYALKNGTGTCPCELSE